MVHGFILLVHETIRLDLFNIRTYFAVTVI